MPARPNPRWELLPIGVRLTLAEVAAILGIGKDSLRIHYCLENADQPLPDGVRVVREGRRAVLIIRDR